MKKVSILFLLFFCSNGFSQAKISGSLDQVGTSMANFLKIGVGARSLAMGDASVAACNDVSALYWNVGILDRLPHNQVLFQTTNWLVDTHIYFVGAAYKMPGIGSIGLSSTFFSSGEIEETTLRQPDGTGQTFSADEFAVGLSYSRQLTDRFSAGITVKYVQESLSKENASAVAFDIGSIFETNFLNNLRIGMALCNLGTTMHLTGSDLIVYHVEDPRYPTKFSRARLETENWDIPLYFRFGLATDVIRRDAFTLTVAGEVLDSRDYTQRFSLGSELAIKKMFFLRGGYKFNYDEHDLSFGAGLLYALTKSNHIQIDYAYGQFGVFDNTQRFSVLFTF